MMTLIDIICHNKVPKVLLRYIMMNFLDLDSIKKLILTVREMNVLDNYSKNILLTADKGFYWNCENGYLDAAKWLYNIDLDYKRAFRLACKKGHLDIAQWLR